MSIIGTRPPLISETNFYELHHRASGRGAFVLWQRHSALCRPFPERYRAVPRYDDKAGGSGRRVICRLFYQPCALCWAQIGGDRP